MEDTFLLKQNLNSGNEMNFSNNPNNVTCTQVNRESSWNLTKKT